MGKPRDVCVGEIRNTIDEVKDDEDKHEVN